MERKYRYTHSHEGKTLIAPEFYARNNKDARAYVRAMKGIGPNEPLQLCGCNGEKLECERAAPKTECANGNVIPFPSPNTAWREVSLL